MKIITGRAGTGKSYYCMNEIKKNLEEGIDCPLLYIVPEQASLTSEYEISKIIGKNGTLDVQVISFKRLCNRIYNEFGYKSNAISKAGKAMLIYSIMKDLENDLVLLKGVDKKQGLVGTVCDYISEFKRYNITPDMLLCVKAEGMTLSNKLKELAFIYREYENRINEKFTDNDDDLSVVKSFIEKSKLVIGAKIWIDGFDGFTPQEIEIIKILNKIADVTISITVDNSNSDLFLLNRKTIEKLKKFANIDEIYLDKNYRFETAELVHLEKNFNRFPFDVFSYGEKENTSNIDISIFSNMYNEVENIACRVLSDVRDNGYRYNNIFIATRNIEMYSPIIKMIFDRYNIPYFIDTKTELAIQPLICLITSLLEICDKGYKTECIISYLKTGLTNIDDYNDIDIIENYVLKYGIKGSKWVDSWAFDKPEINEKVNSIREQIIKPIDIFKNKLSSKKTIKEISNSIYEFLIDIKVEENLQLFLDKFTTNNDDIISADAIFINSYLQVWNIFISLLDELVLLMGDKCVSFETYNHIIKTGFNSNQIGLIPTNKDQLVIGDISRSKSANIDILYVLGVNDGLFPMQYDDEGFINDIERNYLIDSGIEVAKDTKMLLLEENFNIYKILSTPKKELHISYPITDDSGTTLRPSMVIKELKKMFPNIKTNDYVINSNDFKSLINTVDSTFVHLASKMREYNNNEKIDSRWHSVYTWYNDNKKEDANIIKNGLGFKNETGRLTKDTSNQLYGNTLSASVSKMETFAECPFRFYLTYGLNVKERKIYKLDTPDIGSFIHEVLDKFAKYIESQNLLWRNLERDDISNISSNIVDEMLRNFKNGLFASNNKLKFFSIKLKRIVKRILWIITVQLKNSDFDVLGSEVEFGEGEKYPAIEIELQDGQKLSLKGKIDRIDIAKTLDGNYIRIIDYKTYDNSLNLSNVFYGLQLQLITYLDATSSNEFISSGALYLKLDDPIIKTKKNISLEEIEDEIRNSLKMNGIILADVKLVKAMDNTMVSESSNLNLKIKKDGSFGGMPVATEEELKSLMKHTKYVLKQFAEEIYNGNVDISPEKHKGGTGCNFCKYKEICNFDRELGNRFKKINELKNDEVFEQIKMF